MTNSRLTPTRGWPASISPSAGHRTTVPATRSSWAAAPSWAPPQGTPGYQEQQPVPRQSATGYPEPWVPAEQDRPGDRDPWAPGQRGDTGQPGGAGYPSGAGYSGGAGFRVARASLAAQASRTARVIRVARLSASHAAGFRSSGRRSSGITLSRGRSAKAMVSSGQPRRMAAGRMRSRGHSSPTRPAIRRPTPNAVTRTPRAPRLTGRGGVGGARRPGTRLCTPIRRSGTRRRTVRLRMPTTTGTSTWAMDSRRMPNLASCPTRRAQYRAQHRVQHPARPRPRRRRPPRLLRHPAGCPTRHPAQRRIVQLRQRGPNPASRHTAATGAWAGAGPGPPRPIPPSRRQRTIGRPTHRHGSRPTLDGVGRTARAAIAQSVRAQSVTAQPVTAQPVTAQPVTVGQPTAGLAPTWRWRVRGRPSR